MQPQVLSSQSTLLNIPGSTARTSHNTCRSQVQPFKQHLARAGRSKQASRALCSSSNGTATYAQQLDRRALLLALVATPGLASLQPAVAAAESVSLSSYKDKADEFSLSVPADWIAGEGAAEGGKGYSGASGTRRALAWYPEGDLETNLTVLITNVGADYTRLSSFGDAEQFGGNVVAQMDRSYLNRSWNKPKTPPQEAKLINAKNNNGMYFIEYTVKKPSQDEKHLLSAIALGFNGRYNRLYTVTGQCRESQLEQFKPTLQSVLQTFAPPAPPPY